MKFVSCSKSILLHHHQWMATQWNLLQDIQKYDTTYLLGQQYDLSLYLQLYNPSLYVHQHNSSSTPASDSKLFVFRFVWLTGKDYDKLDEIMHGASPCHSKTSRSAWSNTRLEKISDAWTWQTRLAPSRCRCFTGWDVPITLHSSSAIPWKTSLLTPARVSWTGLRTHFPITLLPHVLQVVSTQQAPA